MTRPLALLALALSLAATAAVAAPGLSVVGLFPGKAVVSIDGGPPRSMSVGDHVGMIRLVSVGSDRATFNIDGHVETLPMGSYLAGKASANRSQATLSQDSRGHYMAAGAINGVGTTFLVDTGASLVVLSAQEADRMAIPWKSAPRNLANTANGSAVYRMVKLDRVKVGDVELTNVEAGVMEQGYTGPPLLGMSFLSRTEVTRDGQSMVLTRRF